MLRFDMIENDTQEKIYSFFLIQVQEGIFKIRDYNTTEFFMDSDIDADWAILSFMRSILGYDLNAKIIQKF